MAQTQTDEPKILSGIALSQTANLVLNMTEGGSPVAQEDVWKVNFKAV